MRKGKSPFRNFSNALLRSKVILWGILFEHFWMVFGILKSGPKWWLFFSFYGTMKTNVQRKRTTTRRRVIIVFDRLYCLSSEFSVNSRFFTVVVTLPRTRDLWKRFHFRQSSYRPFTLARARPRNLLMFKRRPIIFVWHVRRPMRMI